jgi:hypothetical protein
MSLPAADALQVSSVRGDIDQKNQLLRFLQDVRVTRQNGEMRGDLLIYNGTAKTMTFPQGGSFSNSNMGGSASVVRWRLEERLLQAEGEVNVDFTDNSDKQERNPVP